MTAVKINNSIESSTPRGDRDAPQVPQLGAGVGVLARVDEELEQLVDFMPDRYRVVFCFRWGLCGAFSHIISQTAQRFELSRGTVQEMLERCLWNLARHAHTHQLPALQELLGEDRERWAERAWASAQGRWGTPDSAFSQTVLWLALAGVDVPDAHWIARQHMVSLGLGGGSRCARPRSEEQLSQDAERMLAQVIWPAHPARLSDLDGFGVRRPLAEWAPAKSGVVVSGKLGRLVGFDSDLERVILRQLELAPQVVDYCEQPVTIPYVLDGEAHEYTPDVVVRLEDGRGFIIEAKPIEGLGDFTNWMKWASLARWCARAGLGFWIGSPQRSILEHRTLQPDPDCHELIAGEVQAGPVSEGEYVALKSLVGPTQLGLAATAELLLWRQDRRELRRPEGADLEEARHFWSVIDQHGQTPPAGSELGGHA
jgi:hypothetical protein